MQSEGTITPNSSSVFTNQDEFAEEKLLNLNVLDEYYGGANNPEAIRIFRDCAIRMLDSLDRRLELLKLSIENGNAKDALYYAHQLRGSFNAMGSHQLSSYCEKIEKKALNNDLSDCLDIEKNISHLSKRFAKELKQLVGTDQIVIKNL